VIERRTFEAQLELDHGVGHALSIPVFRRCGRNGLRPDRLG
jgi:hypothetical protein